MTTDAYPLAWPHGRPRTPAGKRKTGKFARGKRIHRDSHSWNELRPLSIADALERLQGELDRLGARLPIVSSNVELRLDGRPRSGQAEPADPGVCVYFQLAGKPHAMPCDTYRRVADNIAAVAAHIEATRAIERHGVATVAEMFAGFQALPGPSWRAVLKLSSNATLQQIEEAYRRLARERHPDAPGGSHEAMSELNAAVAQARKDLGA